jgi:RNA polymerase sigma-70 factor, ECF subfamily
MGDVTVLLQAWRDGNAAALDELAPMVESELRRLARHYLSGERAGHTLQATALVNEAFMRLINWKDAGWQNRAHFFGVASGMMRRVLVDHARRRNFAKRGGGAVRVSLADISPAAPEPGADIVAVDEALTRLASFDERKSRIVELRFFGGLSEEEIAEVTQLSLRTVQREWNLARAWLFRELSASLS